MTDTADKELADFLAERNKALAKMDMDYAEKMMPKARHEVRLMAMHKARYECTAIAPVLRSESGEWLRNNGLGRLDGSPILPHGELPE